MKLFLFTYSKTIYEESHVDEFIALIASNWNDAHNQLLYLAGERSLLDDWTNSIIYVTGLTESNPSQEVYLVGSSLFIRLEEQSKGYAVVSPFEN